MLIGLMVDAAKLIGAPPAERRPLIVDEDAAVLDLGATFGRDAAIEGYVTAMLHRHVGPPRPRRHTESFAEGINAVDSAAFVGSRNVDASGLYVEDMLLGAVSELLVLYVGLGEKLIAELANEDLLMGDVYGIDDIGSLAANHLNVARKGVNGSEDALIGLGRDANLHGFAVLDYLKVLCRGGKRGHSGQGHTCHDVSEHIFCYLFLVS